MFVKLCFIINPKRSFLLSYRVLRISNGLGEPGAVNWDLALCLLLAWIICYLCVCKGVKSSGKVRSHFMHLVVPDWLSS